MYIISQSSALYENISDFREVTSFGNERDSKNRKSIANFGLLRGQSGIHIRGSTPLKQYQARKRYCEGGQIEKAHKTEE